MATPLDRILSEAGVENLIEILAERLAPTDLQTLLLEVYRRRAAPLPPARLLEQYQTNRFVRPSSVNPLHALEFDRQAFSLAASLFEPIELSPVCPLATTSAFSKVSQDAVVTTIRNTEVVSDPTNCMALECAVRRKVLGRSEERVRLCASHRLVRTQTFSGPASFSHFRVFAVCTAGRDDGNHCFEFETLREHIGFYVRLLTSIGVPSVRLTVTDFSETVPDLEARILNPLTQAFPEVQAKIDPHRTVGRGYYPSLCFHLYATDARGDEYNLADGGLVEWTQQLLSNKKERLMISGLGSERICALFSTSPSSGWEGQ